MTYIVATRKSNSELAIKGIGPFLKIVSDRSSVADFNNTGRIVWNQVQQGILEGGVLSMYPKTAIKNWYLGKLDRSSMENVYANMKLDFGKCKVKDKDI